MSYETILTEAHDGILTITLNRPAARNAMSSQMMEEFSSELERWDNDPTQRVCIITNAGSCFCAGADLKELAAGTYHLPQGKEDWGVTWHVKAPVQKASYCCCQWHLRRWRIRTGTRLRYCHLQQPFRVWLTRSTTRTSIHRRRRHPAFDAANTSQVCSRTHFGRR